MARRAAAVGLWSFAIAVALETFAGVGDASAYPVYRRYYQQVYEEPVRCELCHGRGGGTERNSYAEDWQERGEDLPAFARVEGVDSDGDGIKNRDEILGGSNPGDERSTPERPGSYWLEAEEIPIPTEQLRLVMEEAAVFEAIEPNLTPRQQQVIERGVGDALLPEERYPTLYFGSREGERSWVALFRGFRLAEGPFSLLVSIRADGKVHKIAMFRAGAEEGSRYRAFLNCLQGHGKGELGASAPPGCPQVPDRRAATAGIVRAIRSALWTAEVLYAERAGEPDREDAGPRANRAGARPPTRASSGSLDLVAAEPSTRVEVRSSAWMTAAALGSIAALGLCIALSTWLAVRFWSPGASSRPLRLSDLPPSWKLLCLLVLISMLFVQALAAVDVYVQTQRVHGSTWDYFQYLTWARLLGTSHAHIMGYALMYGLFAALLCMTSVRETIKAAVVATLLWSGLFDVASWWGIKYYSPRFEWLAIASGIATASMSLVVFALVTKALWSKPSS